MARRAFNWKYFVELATEMKFSILEVGDNRVVFNYDICTDMNRDRLEVSVVPDGADGPATIKFSGRCYESDFPDVAIMSVTGRQAEVSALMMVSLIIGGSEFAVTRGEVNLTLHSDGSISDS